MALDYELAHKLADLCDAAYYSPITIQNKCEKYAYTTTCLEIGANFCFLAEGVTENVIVFRGVNDWKDALLAIDVGFNSKYHDLFTVHKGFYRAWEEIQPQLDKLLNSVNSDKPLIICGHSLGGAIAQLFGGYYSDHFKNIQVYTFGSPRVGTSSWARFIKKQSLQTGLQFFCFINLSDIITSLPWKLFGWKTINPIRIGQKKLWNHFFATRGLSHKIARYRRTLLLILHGRLKPPV